ncbi:ATP-dependent helicase [Nesterenkonia sp. MY13]|uniref:DNA 3'-5' helicase n=1 Tax=Nesterenkonia sedimenti TaxID=1463632 RepID=A0A7X8YDK5_9MICC|nr:UrvD/REP family ATP-dependent DNA helicase [Nesterenkonia sedimenti]NLS09277.1 ATP-dependent helicase [Nesterenkonia sedimenti]
MNQCRGFPPPGSGPILVYGRPGSGKTEQAVAAGLKFLQAGHDARRLSILSPTRATAARIRDSLELQWSATGPEASLSDQPSRSFAAYAFWLLGEARRRRVLRFSARSPRLLSGAEQDRILREILAEFAAEHGHQAWPGSLAEAATTEGFRKEVRELIERCSEQGITAEQLHSLGLEHNRQEWQVAAEIYAAYRRLLDSPEYADAFDPAGLIQAACEVLEADEQFLAAERQRLQLLVIDDLQEAGSNVLRLLRLVGAGKDVLAFANPDTAVQGFRGARPDKLRDWTTKALMSPDAEAGLPGAQPQIQILEGSHRLRGEISRLYSRVVQRIGAVGPAQLRRAEEAELAEAGTETGATGGEDEVTVAAATAAGEHIAEQAVLAEILERYDSHGVPFGQIAVIARSGSTAHGLARQLRARGVPVRQSMSEFVLNQEPAVTPLLEILARYSQPSLPDEEAPTEEQQAELDLELLLSLLSGPYGDTDPLTQRSLRQLLLRAERAAAAEQQRAPRSAEQLLFTAVHNPEDPVLVTTVEKHPGVAYGLGRAARMLQAARETIGEQTTETAGPEEVLWAVWEAARVTTGWAETTEGSGMEAERADRHLDSVLALFQAAERFADQNPRATAADFVDHMRRIELPMDSLAATAAPEDSVEILTPTTAAGREFNTVILYGLQEGRWPNLRPRGALLGTTELVDLIEYGSTGQQNPLIKRLTVLQDEYRLFAAAASRASHRVFALAVESAEEQPSLLLDLVTPADQRPAVTQLRPEPPTSARLVAELRRFLETSAAQDQLQSPEAQEAAQALAALADAGIRGADPQQWWGLAELTDTRGLHDPEEKISIYPSAVEKAITNPLAWFTSAAGGTEATDFARSLGVLIHAVAEEHPEESDPEVLTEALAKRWDALGLKPGWQADAEWERAQDMLRQLAQYHARAASRQLLGTELHAEAELTVPTGSNEQLVRISGTIDRIERTPEGQLYIVDLKTGRRATPGAEMSRHPQLGLYQLLLTEAELPEELKAPIHQSALLFVAANQNHTLREQDSAPLDDPAAWPRKQLTAATETMTSASFTARHEPNQDSTSRAGCRIGPLCPLCTDTKQVTQP